MKLNLTMFLDWLLVQNPQFLGDFIQVIDKFIDAQTEGIELPKRTPEGAHDWLNDPLDGTYTLKPSGITDEQIAVIQQGIAGGMVNEKAASFLKGFLIAIKIAL